MQASYTVGLYWTTAIQNLSVCHTDESRQTLNIAYDSLSSFQQQLKHTLFQQSFPDIIMWHFLTVTPKVVLAVASLLRPLQKLIIDRSIDWLIHHWDSGALLSLTMLLSFFLSSYFTLSSKFAFVSPPRKQAWSNWKFSAMYRMVSVRDRLLFSAIWPSLLGVLSDQTFLATSTNISKLFIALSLQASDAMGSQAIRLQPCEHKPHMTSRWPHHPVCRRFF